MLAQTGRASARTAAESGRICATAAAGQRDLQECATRYPELFPPKPFDAALFGTVAQANAFSAPWLDAGQLRVANRASLWGFAVDWQIDYLATSLSDVDNIVSQCIAVADGSAESPLEEPLTMLLVNIRDELAKADCFGSLEHEWREELRRMLAAMALEWQWRDAAKSGASLPTFDRYLDNSDNLGSSFVDLSHWIITVRDGGVDDVAEVVAAARAQQKVLRLINDLGTYQRDIAWGDLNALMLGLGQDEISAHLATLVEHCHEMTDALHARQPELATFLERQMAFCAGFYQLADYWGAL